MKVSPQHQLGSHLGPNHLGTTLCGIFNTRNGVCAKAGKVWASDDAALSMYHGESRDMIVSDVCTRSG